MIVTALETRGRLSGVLGLKWEDAAQGSDEADPDRFTRYGKRLQDEKAEGQVKLGKGVTFHTLRHTFSSWYAMRPGSDLNFLRELLGYQDLKTR